MLLDPNGRMPKELLDSEAQIWAKEFSHKQISTHQVRRFFDEVKKYQRLLDAKIKEYADVRPLIYMLKSKANYAVSRDDKIEPFADFITKAINEIKKGNEEQEKLRFKHFCLFFEAVYGFADLKK
jgi:CRISPR type III-A-associated protein Csm2